MKLFIFLIIFADFAVQAFGQSYEDIANKLLERVNSAITSYVTYLQNVNMTLKDFRLNPNKSRYYPIEQRREIKGLRARICLFIWTPSCKTALKPSAQGAAKQICVSLLDSKLGDFQKGLPAAIVGKLTGYQKSMVADYNTLRAMQGKLTGSEKDDIIDECKNATHNYFTKCSLTTTFPQSLVSLEGYVKAHNRELTAKPLENTIAYSITSATIKQKVVKPVDKCLIAP